MPVQLRLRLYSYTTTPVASGAFLHTSEARKREEVERTVSNHSVVMPSPQQEPRLSASTLLNPWCRLWQCAREKNAAFSRHFLGIFAPFLYNPESRQPRSLYSVLQRDISGFSRFPANESLRRTGLHSFLSAKSIFYLPESIAMLPPPFGPIKGPKWFFQISSQ